MISIRDGQDRFFGRMLDNPASQLPDPDSYLPPLKFIFHMRQQDIKLIKVPATSYYAYELSVLGLVFISTIHVYFLVFSFVDVNIYHYLAG